jgi:hypothetical protein
VANEIVQIGALKFFFLKCCLSESICENVSCLLHVTYLLCMHKTCIICKEFLTRVWSFLTHASLILVRGKRCTNPSIYA